MSLYHTTYIKTAPLPLMALLAAVFAVISVTGFANGAETILGDESATRPTLSPKWSYDTGG
jgi:hypothetical protein